MFRRGPELTWVYLKLGLVKEAPISLSGNLFVHSAGSGTKFKLAIYFHSKHDKFIAGFDLDTPKGRYYQAEQNY